MGKRNAEHALDQSLHDPATPLKKHKLDFDSPVCNQEFELTRELVDGSILTDLTKKQWRVGKPIGKSMENFQNISQDKKNKQQLQIICKFNFTNLALISW